MSFLKNTLAAVSAVAMLAAPLAASAAPAKAAPVTAPVKAESNLKGASVIVALLALTAVVGGVIIGSKKSKPNSP